MLDFPKAGRSRIKRIKRIGRIRKRVVRGNLIGRRVDCRTCLIDAG